MKRCPNCLSAYDEGQNFCEVDGAALLADPLESIPAELSPSESSSNSRDGWYLAAIGVLAGILMCVTVYFGYLAPSSQDNLNETKSVADRFQTPERFPLQPAGTPRRLEETRIADEETEPTEEDAEEITAEPTPESTPQTVSATRRLNDGPISTGTKRVDMLEAVVEFTDGTAIKVEAAWEDGQGVWYRRGGLVSFVERERVKSITESVARATQEAVVTP